MPGSAGTGARGQLVAGTMLYLPVEVRFPGHMATTTSGADTWGEDGSGGGAKRLPRGDDLGASVYELGPGHWMHTKSMSAC